MERFIIFLLLITCSWADEPGKEYRLARENWHLDINGKIDYQSRREISKADLKYTDDGSWSMGTFATVDEEEIGVERVDEDAYLVTYRNLKNTYRMLIHGERTSSIERSPLHQKTVRVERKDGIWKASVVEGDLEDADEDKLQEQLDRIGKTMDVDYSVGLFGLKPRKVGETWVADQPHAPWMGDETILEGKATVTFVKVEDYEGEPCAFLEFTLVSKTKHPGEEVTYVDFDGKGTVIRSLKSLLDYQVSASGQIVSRNVMGEGAEWLTKGKYDLKRKIKPVLSEDKK